MRDWKRNCAWSLLLAAGLAAVVGAEGDDPPAAPPAATQTPVVSFSRDVVPALTKAGCNAGTCHGSFQGRGGFRLSLLGFDPAADFEALAKEGRGRRVSLAAPTSSLMLRKPTGAVPHAGGRRFSPDSETYRILHAWICQGVPGPSAKDPLLTRLEVTPSELLLPPGGAATLRVRAAWSDAASRDVTALALYDDADLQVAEVTAEGSVKAIGHGRTAITVRYLGQVAAVTVTVPYARGANLPNLLRNNFIDELAIAEWKKVGVAPAPLCDDATFLRRASLDLAGTLPTPEQVRSFVAATDPHKRAKLIDELLERPEYVEFWTLRWGDLLRAHRRFLGEKGLASFQGWLRRVIRENRPAPQIVRELLTARGNLYTNGPVAMYFVDRTPEDLAETVSQVFLGVRLQCARCHHHPFEVWSQEDYYGMAAFFAKVRRKDTRESGTFGGAQAVLIAESGLLPHPQTGAAVAPQALGAKPLPVDATGDPRPALADWLTAAENPYFARNLVNRYWGYLLGRGLVHPIDDQRATNPATHPALLDALTRDFVAHKHDLKHLLRTICNSRVYQLAAEVAPHRDAAGVFLTHHVPRRLSAEVLLDAVNHATGATETFAGLPPGLRAVSLADSAVVSDFLDIFGRAKRTTTCLCERSSEPDLRQALHLSNNEALQRKLADPSGRIAKLLAAKKSDNETCEELYLATLCRQPTAEEKRIVLKAVSEAPSRKEGWEDLLWALLNCAEFSYSR
jgi:hypothetical protein